MKKNLKITLISGMLLSLAVSIGCNPQAIQGTNPSGSPTPPITGRTELCDLLRSLPGITDADKERCLTATTISPDDIARLCSVSSTLNADQRARVIADLTDLGVNVHEQCPIAGAGPTATPTVVPTEIPTAPPSPTEPPRPTATATTTVAPTATDAPIPSASPTVGTGGGGGFSHGGTGGGTTDSGPSGHGG